MASWLILLLAALTCVSCQVSPRDTNFAAQPTQSQTAPQPAAQPTQFQAPQTGSVPLQSTQTERPEHVAMSSTDSTQGLPDALIGISPLWEVERQDTPRRAGSVTRLYDNGELYTWSNQRRVSVDGKPRRKSAPYAWRLDARLKTEGIDQVKALLQSGFMDLPEDDSVSAGADQGVMIRRAHVDGTEHQVTLPSAATADLPEVIQEINYAIQSNIIPGAVPLTQSQ